ncbi:hypothetical protein [Lacticaseibacillus porcinae]|uniref:hypothetical protein n=1 Tax=Lacticaseibacillus porcinae TaxID=1123687 RepID=UPI000F7A7C38|nr:hypothetical protein [Lacticaseibacillus porcinae]
MLENLIFWGGLAYFAFQDATTHSVPSQPFELWCVQLYLLSIPTAALWWLPLLWWVAFSILAHFNYLGSADAWMIGVLASHFTLMPLLWVLLIACVTGLLHATSFKQRQLPWLPHLALGSLIVTIVQLI